MDHPSPPVGVDSQLPAVLRGGTLAGPRADGAAGRAARFTLWTLFASVALVSAWVLTFPYEAWQQRLLSEAGRRAGLLVTAERWTADGPMTIEWHDVSLASGGVRLRADRAAYRLPPTALVLALAAPGDATWARLARLGAWSLDGTVRLDAAPLEGTPEPGSFVIRGLLRASFEPVPADPAAGEAPREGTAGRIELANVTVEGLTMGDIASPSLNFEGLSLALTCGDTLCRVDALTGTGPDGRVSGQGTVTWQRQLAAGELAGTLSLTLTEPAVQRGGEALRAAAPPGTMRRLTVAGPLTHPRTTVEPAP